jgi:hypothetical protein
MKTLWKSFFCKDFCKKNRAKIAVSCMSKRQRCRFSKFFLKKKDVFKQQWRIFYPRCFFAPFFATLSKMYSC